MKNITLLGTSVPLITSILFCSSVIFSLGCSDCPESNLLLDGFFDQCSSIGGAEKERDITFARPEVVDPTSNCLTCDEVPACTGLGYKEVCGGLITGQGTICDNNQQPITGTGCITYGDKGYCYSDNCGPETNLCDVIPVDCPAFDFSKICGTIEQCPPGTF